jgi:hypothetical protein
MAVRHLEAVQQLPGSARNAESRFGRIGPITLEVKQTGERRAGNPHAAFDVAEAGDVARSRCCDTRRRKGETTGNTNFDLHRRASLRPYRENLDGDGKGKGTSGSNREAESTDAPTRGGLLRSSAEAGQCPWSEGSGPSPFGSGQPATGGTRCSMEGGSLRAVARAG